jgi:hypothetical protein
MFEAGEMETGDIQPLRDTTAASMAAERDLIKIYERVIGQLSEAE